MRGDLALVPIGPVPQNLLAWLAQRLEQVLGVAVTVGDGIPLPETGYNRRRRQYRGDTLLTQLRALRRGAAEASRGSGARLLGLADADCYAPGLNFIFGQATLGGQEAFVALPRLRPSFYDLPENPALFRQRALKEAVHELGHTCGLPHCPDRRCVMFFSNTLQDTDAKGEGFCQPCRDRLS